MFSIVEHIYRCRLLTRNLLTSEHLSTSQHSKRNVSFTKTSVTLWHLKTMSWETITEEWWWSHRKNDSCCCSNVKLMSRRRKRSWENWKTISFTWRGCLTLNFKRTWNSNNRFQPWKKPFQKTFENFWHKKRSLKNRKNNFNHSFPLEMSSLWLLFVPQSNLSPRRNHPSNVNVHRMLSNLSIPGFVLPEGKNRDHDFVGIKTKFIHWWTSN